MTTSLNRTVDPASEPVTTTEMKAYLRVTSSAEDALIGSLITAAREAYEAETKTSVISQTWAMQMDCFPSGSKGEILLPRGPVTSVSSIVYYDTAGLLQTWSSSDYIVGAGFTPARVGLSTSGSWPSVEDRVGAVTVTYLAGYADADAVPEDIKSAIKFIVAYWYEQRGDEIQPNAAGLTIPMQAMHLIWHRKVVEV